ncbi:MAG: DUF898 domain-containing protein [Clostridia bacterium]|nr:DUF898 domain-containing protein [Clostridia bacterium]
MEEAKEKIYKLADGGSVLEFIQTAHRGDNVELISESGEKLNVNFDLYGQRYSDICSYVLLDGTDTKLVTCVNFKHDYLRLIKNEKLANKIIGEFGYAISDKSFFTGGTFLYFLFGFLKLLATVFTLGLAYPYLQCKFIEWEVTHTWINGRQLIFTGKYKELYGKYIIWLLLSVVTFGLYYIIKMRLNLIEWETKYTHTFTNENCKSQFTGKWYQLLGVTLISRLVMFTTLSFGYYWAHCYIERWYAKHTIIDGIKLTFDGKGIQFFAKCIVWVALTIITLGIYSLFMAIKIKKWTTKHTQFTNPEYIKVKLSNNVWVGNIKLLNTNI